MLTLTNPEREFRKFIGEDGEEARLVYALGAAMAFKAAAEYIAEEKSVEDAQTRLMILAHAGFQLIDSYEKEMGGMKDTTAK
ncbi:MAG: hypothetical protein ACE5JJ_09555 [Nitrospinota bacterium]